MPSPKRSEVWVEAEGLGRFDRFTSLAIANDMTMPSEAGFEVGDDGSWLELEDFVKHGTQYKVFVDRSLRLTGKVVLNDIPIDAQSGAVVRFTVRTKLADAMYASADPKTKVSGGATVKDFLLALYSPLGYTEADFIFDADVARNLLTGVSRTSGKPAKTFEALTEEKAKVNPPETIFAAADRHLRRFGLMHWDAADGRIVVGEPNNEQLALYSFRLMHPNGQSNNVLTMQRLKDWSDVASVIGVFGPGSLGNLSAVPAKSIVEDDDLLAAGFYRPIIVQASGITNNQQAYVQALREQSARMKGKDTWVITTDGLAHWNGSTKISYGIDTIADVATTIAGGPTGAYLVHRVELRRDAGGDLSNLFMMKKGIWVIS